MRHFVLTFIVLLLMAPSAAMAGVNVGDAVPDFTGKDMLEDTVSLSDYEGKIVVLEWTNHKCPFVRKHYDTGNMQGLQKMAADDDIVWLTIVSSAPGRQGYTIPEEAQAVSAQYNAQAAARILDESGEIGRAFGATVTPHMFVIDQNGQLAYRGAIDDQPSTKHETVRGARNYVREAIDALQQNKPVEVRETKPYGCGIKY